MDVLQGNSRGNYARETPRPNRETFVSLAAVPVALFCLANRCMLRQKSRRDRFTNQKTVSKEGQRVQICDLQEVI